MPKTKKVQNIPMRQVWTLLFITFISLSFTGCGTEKTISENDYRDVFYQYRDLGSSVCKQKNLEYNIVYMLKIDVWKVVCYSKSPLKFYEFSIEE